MNTDTTHINTEYAQERRRWIALDADGAVLGRLASRAADLLRGKHKRFFTPAVDCGDFVIVTNAAKLKVTGTKAETKFYFHHSGYAKGSKVMPFKLQMQRDPRKVVYLAVKRMLPDNRLRQHQLRRLKIYPSAAHPHAAQMAAPKASEAGRISTASGSDTSSPDGSVALPRVNPRSEVSNG